MHLTRNTRARTASALAVAVLTVTLAACGSGSSSGAATVAPTATSTAGGGGAAAAAALNPSGALAAAAKKEGQVVWYAPALGNIDAIAQAFENTYGIKVNIVEMANVELQSRFEAEAKAGKENSDVVTTGFTTFFQTALNNGWITPLSKTIPDFPGTYPAEFVVDNGGSGIIMVSTVGIAYNTAKISNPPTDWAQLAEPQYKGKLVSVDVNASMGYQQFWDALLTKYGAATVAAIGKNITRTFAQVPAEMQSLTSGEGDIAVYTTQGLTAPIAAQGAPIKFEQFNFTTGVNFAVGLTAHAPHPSAAKLFATWLLSDAGQHAINTLSQSSTPLVTSSLPSQYIAPKLVISDARKVQIDNALGVSPSGS